MASWVCCALAPAATRAENAAVTAAVSAAAPAARAVPTQAPPLRHGSTLDDRVKLLTAELNLDPQQQAYVRNLLERQREQVKQAWSDPATPAANRIGATQAIGERTANEIRALLNEEQRKKYIAPKPPHTAADEASKHGLDYWMDPSHANR